MKITEIILEALTPNQTAKLWRDLGKEYDKNIHDNIFKGQSRIYIPLPASSAPTATLVSPIEADIESTIQSVGYKIDDYKTGIASKIDDPSRKVKIGKLIKDQTLLQKFANDKTRAAAKQNNLVVTISRDPVDIAGMSTDRGWVSCMDLNRGINKKYVPAEIKNGAIIVYLTREGDIEINKPIARILIKPYVFKNHMILGADKVYGTAPPAFAKLVDQFVVWANSGSPEGSYKLAKGSYQDSQADTQYHLVSYDNIENAPVQKKIQAASKTSTPSETLVKLAGDENSDVRLTVAGNLSSPPEALVKLAGDKEEDVRLTVASNPSTPPEILIKLADGKDNYIKEVVATNDSTPPEALVKLADNKNEYIRVRVANNASSPPEALVKLAGDKEEDVRATVANNTSTPPEALLNLSIDSIAYIRVAVAANTSTPDEVLLKLAADKNKDVRRVATRSQQQRAAS